MTISALRKDVEAKFKAAGFESADIEADILCEESVGVSRGDLYLNPERSITDTELKRATDFLNRRLNNEPYQYICNKACFRELELYVDSNCLIPRPETEFMLDYVLKKLPQNANVCELGTGSGAIALSIAYERPDCTVHASEISRGALNVARKNVNTYQLKNVFLHEGSLLEPLPKIQYHTLVANLPYIPYIDRENLPPNVRNFEPETALFAEDNGTALIKSALLTAPEYMAPQGTLFFEMGEEQGPELSDFAKNTGQYSEITILDDQYGVPRFLFCRVKSQS